MSDNTRKKLQLLRELASLRKAEGRKIKQPLEAVAQLAEWVDCPVERFFLITLDNDHRVIGTYSIHVGTKNRTFASARDVYRRALLDDAIAVITAHNHPSGNLEPSLEDKSARQQIERAGKLIGVQHLDDIIISHNGYYSYNAEMATYFKNYAHGDMVAEKPNYEEENSNE